VSDIKEAPHQFVDSPAGRLHYQEWGEGKPVILIHGGGAGAFGLSNYVKNIGPLAKEFRVIVPDLPGYGQSDFRDMPDGMFIACAQAIEEIVDHLKLETVSLVGNSLGGGTSLRFSLANPDRLDKLILMGGAGGLPIFTVTPNEGAKHLLGIYRGEGPTPEKIRALMEVMIYDPSVITDELVAQRMKMATDPKVMANPPLHQMKPNDYFLWRQPLETITRPTLLIWGKDDRVVPYDQSLVFSKVIPNSDVAAFAKCGHWVQWEQAEKFNRTVADFIRD